jgi:catechol 2,3-dioxygenase
MIDNAPTLTPEADAGARAPLNRFDHATLRVTDLDRSVDWYQAALDLQVVQRTADTAVLTVGGDGATDLVLRAGGRGVAAFAFGIDGFVALESLAAQLRDRGIEHRIGEGDVPGVDLMLSLTMPSGQECQVVAADGRATGVVYPGRGDGVAPVDTDHVTIVTTDVRGAAQWLSHTFGFAVSDAVAMPGVPEAWVAAWTHITPQHHDVAILADPDPSHSLHHVAFLAADLNHMGEIADRVCSLSEEGRCEWGIGKHGGLGANNYLYFKDPSGNRIEVDSNMEANPFDRPADIYPGEEFAQFISIWNYQLPPEGFDVGS